ncbi:MAG: GNAT family N-acetyltransferase [Patescibacteria group bacterium]
MESITIRKLNEEDWKEYSSLRLSALQSPDSSAFGGSFEIESLRTEDEWKKRLIGKHRFYYGAFACNTLVSFAGVYFNQKNNQWIIVGVFTNPDFRRSGFSKSIIGEILKVLHARGVVKVILTVQVEQLPAIALYKSLGFIEIDKIINENQIVMERSTEI